MTEINTDNHHFNYTPFTSEPLIYTVIVDIIYCYVMRLRYVFVPYVGDNDVFTSGVTRDIFRGLFFFFFMCGEVHISLPCQQTT